MPRGACLLPLASHVSAVRSNFFETEPFHQWSFASHADKMPDKRVWSSYKLPLKEFIKNFTGDHEYYASKTKVWAQLCRLWPHLFVDAVVLVRR